jgi:hypothetical protein
MTTYFCDGLKEVSVVNGVVRLEFHRLEAVQRGQNRELQPVSEFSVALPAQGFIQALGVLESVRARFAEQGLLNAPGSPEAMPRLPQRRRDHRISPDRTAQANTQPCTRLNLRRNFE